MAAASTRHIEPLLPSPHATALASAVAAVAAVPSPTILIAETAVAVSVDATTTFPSFQVNPVNIPGTAVAAIAAVPAPTITTDYQVTATTVAVVGQVTTTVAISIVEQGDENLLVLAPSSFIPIA